MDPDVLVVGAGPVGLMLADELKLAGAEPLVVERLAEPNPERKARGIGSLAAEALRRQGLADELADHHERGAADFRTDHGSPNGHFAWIHKIDIGKTQEPDRAGAFIWQPDLERLLRRYGARLGMPVLAEHTLTALAQDHDRVTATVDTPSGERRFDAAYLVGCDGGRSTVRKLTGPGPHTDALRDVMSDLMDLPQVNAYFVEMMSGLRGRYPMPYAEDAAPPLGQHCPDLSVTVRAPTGDRATHLFALTERGAPLLLYPADDAGLARAAAPWLPGRVTAVPTTALSPAGGRANRWAGLTAALVRPDGVLAWAETAEPADTAEPVTTGSRPATLRAALEHWFGRP